MLLAVAMLIGMVVLVIGLVALLKIILVVFEFAVRLLLVTFGGILAFALADELGAAQGTAVICALAAMAGLWFAFRRHRRAVPRSVEDSPSEIRNFASGADWPRPDIPVERAWQAIARRSSCRRAELDRAEKSCARFLQVAGEARCNAAASLELIELAVMIRKHVPAIEVELRECRSAGPDSALAHRAVDALLMLGRKCQEAMRTREEAASTKLELRISHLEARMKGNS